MPNVRLAPPSTAPTMAVILVRMFISISALRRTVHHDLIAEQADLGVAQDINGFVFAQFGFAEGEQGAVRNVGRGGVAGEEDEIRVAVGPGFEQEETERTEILFSFSVSSVCSC